MKKSIGLIFAAALFALTPMSLYAQDSSKTAQDSANTAQDNSKTAKDSSKTAKDSSKTAQDSSKTGSNPKSYASVSSLIANAMHAAKDDRAIETSKGGIVADDARVYVDAVQAYYDAAKTFSASERALTRFSK